MIVIFPKILIACSSLISLTLLLVSATPIPSVDVASAAGNVDFFTKNSALASVPQATSVTKLFARTDENPVTHLVALKIKSALWHVPRQMGDKGEVAKEIHQLAELIPRLPPHDHIPQLRPESTSTVVYSTIKNFKSLISAWESTDTDRKSGIEGIEACEAAAKAKGLSRDPEIPGKITNMLKDLEKPPTLSSDNSKSTMLSQTKQLDSLVPSILSLTFEEQKRMSQMLERGYEVAAAKIVHWPAKDDCTVVAKRLLEQWQAFNSLLHH
ncbi:hypothetical protein H0H93_005152 [Arthromyces matolae]|nr:hypothetical protein H0H93_005152 [Arthromyces matolae]